MYYTHRSLNENFAGVKRDNIKESAVKTLLIECLALTYILYELYKLWVVGNIN